MSFALPFALAVAAAAGGPTPAYVTPAEKTAAASIRPELLRAHIRLLSSDLLEGRSPATRGDLLAQAYIQSQMEALGLEPGAPGGGWRQTVPLVGVKTHAPGTMVLEHGAERLDLRLLDDFVAFSGTPTAETRVDGAEIVFVGYGIVAPEYRWDDYKGMDLKGKILLMMNNDPEDDPALFEGKTRLYYGRWDYKYEMAGKLGAAGAIIIHTEPSAGYGWQVVLSSWAGPVFSLPDESQPQIRIKAWATEEACRKIARLGGQDLDALRAAAQKRDFRPVPLGVTTSLLLHNDVQRAQTANVIGRLAGSDPLVAKEALIYTAHFDHLGMRQDGRPGEDNIYNGALDNASGVAAVLSIAKAFTALPKSPRRTVYFAAVAGEEQGLLGSEYLAAHPPVLPGRLAADINIDGINIWGRTHDVTMLGLGKSNVDDWVKALAALQGREVKGDQFPDKGYYYRSDQFNLAKIGVPSAYFDVGTDFLGRPKDWGKQVQREFEEKHYHQPSDELRDDWDFSGAVEDVQLSFYLGLKIANAQRLPAWKPGDEFEAARKKALAEVPKDPRP